MQFLYNLINKFGIFIFFIFLEILAFYFISTRSDFHKNAIGHRLMSVNGFLSSNINDVTHFFSLSEENEVLAAENAQLKERLDYYKKINNPQSIDMGLDSVFSKSYSYTSAQIVDYSINKKDNYFLINKGSKDGIEEDMGVLSPRGVVGSIISTADHYAYVLSILHSKSKIKAKVKGNSRFGIVVWKGQNPDELSLLEIPKYIKIAVGDTIVTAGASAAYPEGALIGKIKSLKQNDNTGDYDITISMFDDLTKVRNVYVIENLDIKDIQKAKAEADAITE